MLSVALETSHRQASVAVRTPDEELVCALDGERAHASDCIAILSELVAQAGCTPESIDAVFVGTGPGSYTGLRIGIGTALGLARGASAALRGEPSGEALIWRELEVGEDGVYLLDARQNEFYFAHYRKHAEDVEVLTPPSVLSFEELLRRVPKDVWIFGDESVLEFAGLREFVGDRFRRGATPQAIDLLDLAERRLRSHGPHALDAVVPLYLRPFEAKTRRR